MVSPSLGREACIWRHIYCYVEGAICGAGRRPSLLLGFCPVTEWFAIRRRGLIQVIGRLKMGDRCSRRMSFGAGLVLKLWDRLRYWDRLERFASSRSVRTFPPAGRCGRLECSQLIWNSTANFSSGGCGLPARAPAAESWRIGTQRGEVVVGDRAGHRACAGSGTWRWCSIATPLIPTRVAGNRFGLAGEPSLSCATAPGQPASLEAALGPVA